MVTEPVRSLANISGSAPLLSDEDAKQFKMPRVGLDGILALYHEDSFECQSLHPEWYVIKRITKNGVACYRIISRLIDNL